jgi:hypothetical protein
MTNTEFIVTAITQKPGIDSDQTCCLCGGTRIMSEWRKAKEIFSGNFTDYNMLRYKQSDVLCDFCVFSLSDESLASPKGARCGLRLYSYLVENNQFIKIDFSEKPFYLFEHSFNPPFILVFSQSGKKHIAFKSLVSHNSALFYVCTDNLNIQFERSRWFDFYKIAKSFYENKCTKDELLAGTIPPWKFQKYSLSFSDYKKLQPVRHTEQFKLMVNSLYKIKTEEVKTCPE